MESFNVGNLVSSAMGAVASVASAVMDTLSSSTESTEEGGELGSVAGVVEAVLGVKAAFAKANEDGTIDEEEAEEIFEDVVKAVVGALILRYGCATSESENEEGDLLGDIPIQVTDGAAVTITYDENSVSESKSIWDYFVEAEIAQEQSDEIVRQGNEQLINNMLDYSVKAEIAQEKSDEIVRQGNEQLINNMADNAIKAEMLQEQSDEMTQQGISQGANYAWNTLVWSEQLQEQTDQIKQDQMNQFNAPDEQGRDRVYVIGGDLGAADGLRVDGQLMIAFDATHPDVKILGAGAAGPGSLAAGTSFFVGTGRSVDGLNGLMGGGGDDGGSISFVSYDHSYSETSDVQTVAVSLGSTDFSAEAHHTETDTIDIPATISEKAKQAGEAFEENKAEFERGENQFIQDKIKKGLPNGADYIK